VPERTWEKSGKKTQADPMVQTQLCECHGHIMMDGVNLTVATSRHKNGVNVAWVRAGLAALADNGVAYFRDGGDNLGVSLCARELAIEYGIRYATPAFAIHKEGRYGGIVGRSFGTLAEYRQCIKDAKKVKADFIKLMLSGIIAFTVYGDLSCPPLPASEIKELVTMAHNEGMNVMAHVNGSDTIKAALEAGTDSIEHGYFMDEECLDLLAETKAVWVPTLAPVSAFSACAGTKGAVATEVLQKQMDCIFRAFRKGAFIASGSDSGAHGVPHGEGILAELSLMHQSSGMDEVLFLKQVNIANERIKELFAGNRST
jgi:hypothetical protein